MIVKYINCHVKPALKSTFSEGQRCWQRTAESDGFIAQIGGWQDDSAIILALWERKESVEHFMQLSHDAIAEDANQQDSYNSLEVDYLQQVLDIPGHHSALLATRGSATPSPTSLTAPDQALAAELMKSAQFIGITQCNVTADKVTDFIQQQINLWNPAMAAVTGMLGGMLLRSSSKGNPFVVITYWLTEASHQHYMQHVYLDIQAIANQKSLTEHVQDHQLKVEPHWRFAHP
ncbi:MULTISPECIES: DUF4937 domain-containing protein [unclassified Shewanella]|uniref:DUF4937 domain-containing protein n=1 Tax=unclassified Shewanella TaxID=196818 RepID=UPI000C79CDA9|nr:MULTISPECIES: DUF4937 domain-containing protein [unclassified Shewanella]PKG56515.1 hypothetical protein CXF82_14460 [Shewanella sp. GutDb-MelDb]PKG74122.1 hypothetical protein CXF86_14255 [Shewanella sp. GutCb]